MLKERKCLMCKNYKRDKKNLFVHRCKAYPRGIPDDILDQDTSQIDCNNKYHHFEWDTRKHF